MSNTKAILDEILMPYQKAWIEDQSRFKIGMWSRQTGKSFATAGEANISCQLNPKSHWVVLSAGERQALEWMEKAKKWAKATNFIINSYDEHLNIKDPLLSRTEIKFENGSRITAIPANPDTARGYSANLILDEFAIHEKPFDIWAAIVPSITNPLSGEKKLRIVSTPKGRGNKFADLWAHNTNYSKHKVTIEDAARMGLPVNIEELKAAIDDPDIWAQEFMCEFVDNTSVLLTYETLGKCESDAIYDPGDCNLYMGMDIGRHKDLSVITTVAQIGDVYHTIRMDVLEKMKFQDQYRILMEQARSPRVKAVAIDATGIGAQIAEDAHEELPGKVEEFKFTSTSKNELFSNMKKHFDERTVRTPIDRELREDLHAVEKNVSTGGNISYSAPRKAGGHSDRAIALALALHAAKKQGEDLEAPIIYMGACNYETAEI